MSRGAPRPLGCVRRRPSSRAPLRCVAKRKPVPKPKVEPVSFSRADSIDLTQTIKLCHSWQSVLVVYERHRELPLHPINVAAFFSQLQRTLHKYRPPSSNTYSGSRQFKSRLNPIDNRDARLKSHRNDAQTRNVPLLHKLPLSERQAVEMLCNALAFNMSQCVDAMGGREIATVAR